MEIQGTGGVRPPERVGEQGKVSKPGASAPAGATPKDQVELSSAGRLVNRALQLPEIRTDRVDQLRQEIASGKYETKDRIEKAIDAFLHENQ